MKKAVCFFILALGIGVYCYSQNVEVMVKVTNIKVNGGKIYLAIFSNAESFKKEIPEYAYEMSDESVTASMVVSLPAGFYLLSAFQDSDGDQGVNYNRLGIPREMVAISNYNGKGFPSRNFDKQKIMLDASTKEVTLGLYKF